jgi:superfamily II DNA or RNA helicase
MREAQEYILTNLLDDKRFDYTRKEKVTNNISREIMNTVGCTAGIYSYIWYVDFPKQKRKMQVKYFDKFERIAVRINRSTEKWLVFIGNKSKAGEWTNKIERPYEVVSADTKETEIVDGIIQNEKFEKDVLVTTKLLDNGVNFKDSALKNIVLDTISEVEFMQMIGRKRLQEGEEITVYIPKKSKMFFVGYDNLHFLKIQRILEGDLQRKTFIQEVLDVPETYEIVRRFFVHLYVKEDYEAEEKGVLKLNVAGKYKVDHLHTFVKRMEEAMEEDAYAFVKEQLKWLGQESDFSEENDLLYEDRQNEFVNLQNYLQKMKDVELNKDQQNVFREKLTLYITLLGNELKSGRTVGKSIITKFFEEQKLPYYIEVKKATKKGDISKWIVRRQEHGLDG